ncbi:Multicopper oxidase with three cupredoxin domains (includes cell division protein FtsP and spore coat protein CotA) [Streptomyces sp. 1222.5]|uniref:multicopper oxidase family protein n=1 Tax=unclassified Streptomyces TaxID=2593676 RepID=UPI00089974C3|nr:MULTISPECIES: multicopper oxidase family protein [unclassified Streptomyces]PKW06649.1 FtsP/CotA-like multicopper oxidase with cupredoxin domain [Streptomyces sp. 5112.2]SED08135.1 Multicopper oxidase with three cupredoxin domains (includes cell division protein FtsP and spore coat protein CotA) [Streptomyces sp. 1222.5]
MYKPSRRTLLRAPIAAAGAGLLASCTGSGSEPSSGPQHTGGEKAFVPEGPRGYVNPSDPEVLAAERKRGTGRVRTYRFTAAEAELDLGGRSVHTWAYNETVPGPLVRVTAGDVLDLTFANRLPATTTLHSHGVRLRCDMDGVPDLTQAAIRPGDEFGYRFTVPHPGTYLLHSHVGMQADRALYAPLVVDDPKEPLSYDKEWVLVLDDWLDGVEGSTPEQVLEQLKPGGAMDMGGMAMGPGHGSPSPGGHSAHPAPSKKAKKPKKPTGPSRVLHDSHSRMLHGEGGSVAYPHYLVNGRLPKDPSVFRCRPGDRVRLRIINAGSETAFRVALGGHRMTVTHTDGYPVKHKTTDALLVGMAERYDVLITAKDGVFPLVALPEGKNGRAVAVLRTSKGNKNLPPADVHPDELDGNTVPARRLLPHDSVALHDRRPDREMRIRLTGGMKKFDWAFDHEPYSVRQRHPVRAGERVRLTLINATDMWHPLHLHGHTFAMTGLDAVGARKDTAIVLPHRKLVVDFDADNPGLWMLHCHNQYHSESGMMTVLGYKR